MPFGVPSVVDEGNNMCVCVYADFFFFQFDAEFRRFSVTRGTKFEEFFKILKELHGLSDIPFVITYTDPVHSDLLPINNDDNFVRALSTARPLLKLLIQRKGDYVIH